MEMFKSVLVFSLLGYSYCGYSGYTILLWLSSDEDMAPNTVWSNSSSSYNSGTKRTSADLIETSTQGYRNTFIDNWSDNPPDKIRVAYRSGNGAIIFRALFNSTGSSSGQWCTPTKALHGTPKYLLYESTHSYNSYSVDFAVSHTNLGAARYRAASLRLANGTVIYIIGASDTQAFLPATPSVSGDCYASYQVANPFETNITTINQTHLLCSALCRERNYSYGGVHEETCYCLGQAPTGPTLTSCTIPCDGDIQEMCGGSSPPAVIFNSVNTDIDVSQFDEPLISGETIHVTGIGEMSYPGRIHLYGFNVSISPSNLPATIQLTLHYRIEPCNKSNIGNSTYTTSFNLSAGETVYTLEIAPLFVQCVYISLHDNDTLDVLSFPVNMTTITIEDEKFVTAQFLTIEAAWRTDEPTTPATTRAATPASNECECDCWVYNLLYGESPFKNLSYAEIQVALKNVTEKLERELAVNKTTLSSTIRKKTSAEDTRASAVAVGYSLGVALLVISLGAIILADFPKMIGSFSILRGNLKSRFGKQEDMVEPTDIKKTDNNIDTF